MPGPVVPDILSHGRLSRAVADLKSQAAVARTETVTGRFEDLTKAANGDVGGLHLLFKAVEDSRSFQSSLSIAGTRATQTQSSLSALTTDARRLSTDALAFLGREDYAALRTIATDSRAAVSTVFAALSATIGGRALFSGDAVDRQPLNDVGDLLADVQAIIAAAPDAATATAALDAYFNDPAGGFETTIYNGGAGEAPTVEIAPGVRVQTAVKANAQPVKDLIRSLAVIASFETLPGGSTAERDALTASAAALAASAESQIIELRAAIGVSEARIDGAKTRHETEETVLTGLVNQRTARDPYEAAARLQLLESQLEASYLLTSRLSGLTLANYLR